MQQAITDKNVISMYWSPDGTKIALLTIGVDETGPSVQNIKTGGLAAPLLQDVVFRWWVYDVKKDTLESLLLLNPTVAFLQTVPFFDQYHLSLTFWSPDSRYFVITTTVSEDNGAVVVVDTTSQADPLQIGDGTLAVWSWQ